MCDRNFLLFLIFVFFLVIIKQTLSEEVEYNIFLCDIKEKCFYGYKCHLESNKIIVISVLYFNKDKNIEYIKFCFFTLVLQILFYLYELHVCQY